ncbi:hypothetical protein [Alteribacter keqinensis]|uniref:hypothetical protein n=1 Tax=Alteribacter keqinensis TaxID=2483800 RepID=UPI003D20535D
MFIVNVEAAIYRAGKWLVIKRGKEESHAAGTLALVGGKALNEGAASDILESTIKREVNRKWERTFPGRFIMYTARHFWPARTLLWMSCFSAETFKESRG